MPYVVGVDIGGTFTDCVVVDDNGKITVAKALSTPADFSLGAVDALRKAAEELGLENEDRLMGGTKLFFHACTVGENTLITRTGAKTGLLATRGFGDAILMMRGKTAEGLSETEAAHLSTLGKPDPIVPRSLVREITERIDYKGSVLAEIDEQEMERVIDDLVAQGVDSLAIALIWSIVNPAHERLLAATIGKRHPKVFVSLSSEVAPFLGEYERTATTVFNAYIGPKIAAYLRNLSTVMKSRGLPAEPLIMQAYGGVLGIEATCKSAVGTIESGPAAGVVGSHFFGELIGEPSILATDMGGTTFKVGIVRDGLVERDYKPVILRYSIFCPKIWVESIGAGGGSIARVDPETGLLKVGPEGAGAKPGPVCYGLGGTEPTVSDADLLLGYLNPGYFLGGEMHLDKEGARRAIAESIGRPLGLSEIEAADGIYRIANSHMSDLIRKATVEKGHDPRQFVLFAYGGAAPVHASRYAAELGISQVVVPLTASVHGATGLISSDVVYDYGLSDHLVVPAEIDRVNGNFAGLVGKAWDDLRSAGFQRDSIIITRSVDMRYRYQVHELNVPFPAGDSSLTGRDMDRLYDDFDELYEKAYGKGSAYREAGKEIVTFRVSAVGRLQKPDIKREPLSGNVQPDAAVKEHRPVYFQEYDDFDQIPIYDFGRLMPGMEISGPGIVETPVTTVVVNPKDRAVIDPFRNVRLYLGGR